MVVLPRFLYLFQNLPIFLPKAFFKLLDLIILPFVWGLKVHRIFKKHLTKPKLMYYWHAAYPGKVTTSTPSWFGIKQDLSKRVLPALLFSLTKSPATLTDKDFMFTSSETSQNHVSCLIQVPCQSRWTCVLSGRPRGFDRNQRCRRRESESDGRWTVEGDWPGSHTPEEKEENILVIPKVKPGVCFKPV